MDLLSAILIPLDLAHAGEGIVATVALAGRLVRWLILALGYAVIGAVVLGESAFMRGRRLVTDRFGGGGTLPS